VSQHAQGTTSCIFEGAIRHRRFETRQGEFRHRIALAYIDLDELPNLLGGQLVARRPGLVRFRRGDYLGDPRTPLADAVRGEVERQTGGARPDGPIRVLTHLRTHGLCFNPVSFYYCFDRSGEFLSHVLAEVTNTPWGERHAYVLSAAAAGEEPVRGDSRKQLHVSPFMGMDQKYTWRVNAPTERLQVHIESRHEEQVSFDATLAMRRRELTRSSLARVTARYPVATLRVLALIYGHALVLKLRGVAVHPHPRAPAA
jgi:uncharacterized protein